MNTNPQPDALRSRWTLEGRIPLSGVAEDSVWHRARSVSTGEDVVLFIVRGEAALEAADAVRRAYLVEDPRLLPVKDIVVLDDPRVTGAEPQPAAASPDGPTTVVEYPLPPAPPLAALLADGPLHPETARAIVGEAATGLEAARRRGVRHQLLDSNRVFVDTRSGSVVLLGVGVEAAAHVGLDRSRETASFQDTAALVALLYRALTGRSPRHDASGDVPLPSTVVDTPIPADLDLLCDLVLNESADEIPETTRELIEALQPWQSIPVTLEAYGHAGAGAPASVAAATDTEPAAVPATAPADTSEATESALGAGVVGAAGAAAVGTAVASGSADSEVDDSSDEELESTALMSAVPDAEPESAPEAAPEPAREAQEAEGLPAEDLDEDTVARAPQVDLPADHADGSVDEDTVASPASAAATAAAPATAAEARALVEELHLDQKRAHTAFPGHLEITSPPPRSQEAVPTEAPAQDDTPSTGAAAAVVGGSLTGGAAAAAASTGVAGADPAIPARTSGTHWPVRGAGAQDSPLTPSADRREPAREPQPVAADAAAATPDHSAPTPTQPVTHSVEAAPVGPVAVTGRTVPIAPVRDQGPIVIHGRNRSLLDEPPVENTFPSARSSLLRDVVAVAVDKDTPEAYAMRPPDQERRSLQSQWIIIGGALAVMIALVIALTTITSGLRDIVADPLSTSEAPTTEAPAEETTDEAPVEPTKEETEEALPAPQPAGVGLSALPGGADPDHTDQQERLLDGDPATFWSTQHYASPDFGGIKEGVGIRVDFAEASTFTAMTITTSHNSGGIVELRTVTPEGGPGEVLATGEFAGDGEVRLEAPEELETDKVMIWIPELPPDSNEQGRFRARIAEIAVE